MGNKQVKSDKKQLEVVFDKKETDEKNFVLSLPDSDYRKKECISNLEF